MDEHEERVRRWAEKIWREKGSPAAGPDAYRDEAEELAAIEENQKSALKPIHGPTDGPYGEPIEEVEEALENEGEFPTLTDQGEEPPFPPR